MSKSMTFEPDQFSLKITAATCGQMLIHYAVCMYSSNQITKKEPKSEARLSEFDWHDLYLQFFWP